jgi:hypothetical protein
MEVPPLIVGLARRSNGNLRLRHLEIAMDHPQIHGTGPSRLSRLATHTVPRKTSETKAVKGLGKTHGRVLHGERTTADSIALASVISTIRNQEVLLHQKPLGAIPKAWTRFVGPLMGQIPYSALITDPTTACPTLMLPICKARTGGRANRNQATSMSCSIGMPSTTKGRNSCSAHARRLGLGWKESVVHPLYRKLCKAPRHNLSAQAPTRASKASLAVYFRVSVVALAAISLACRRLPDRAPCPEDMLRMLSLSFSAMGMGGRCREWAPEAVRRRVDGSRKRMAGWIVIALMVVEHRWALAREGTSVPK